MSEDFKVDRNQLPDAQQAPAKEGKVIDESNYAIRRTSSDKGPAAVGRGGDPFFRNIRATKEQLLELIEETQTVQDWVQRETCNNVALACLEEGDLKEMYYAIKDGFGEYGKISLMGFKTPAGVEIPRLKIYDTNGEVLEVLTGPMAIDEINKRALAYKESTNQYEEVPDIEAAPSEVIADYKGAES